MNSDSHENPDDKDKLKREDLGFALVHVLNVTKGKEKDVKDSLERVFNNKEKDAKKLSNPEAFPHTGSFFRRA